MKNIDLSDKRLSKVIRESTEKVLNEEDYTNNMRILQDYMEYLKNMANGNNLIKNIQVWAQKNNWNTFADHLNDWYPTKTNDEIRKEQREVQKTFHEMFDLS